MKKLIKYTKTNAKLAMLAAVLLFVFYMIVDIIVGKITE